MIRYIRFRVSSWLFDLAARIYPPFEVRFVAQYHHVGDRWLEWKIGRDA